MRNKRRLLSKTSKFVLHALLVLYSIVLTRVTCSAGGLFEYRESQIKRRPVLDQRTKTRENREVYKSRMQSGYPDISGSPDTEISQEVSNKKVTSRSASVGSVHHSGANTQATQNNMAYIMTMSYRPGDGVKFSAEEKEYVEAIRNSNIDDSLQTITKELHGFLENNWPGWRGNWDDYYIGLSILANIGLTVDNLPEQHEIIKIKDLTYYYAGSVYYAKFRDIYVVVPPPHGAITGTMPAEYTNVYVGNTAYFNCGGAFYVKVDNGYQVVAPPVGAIVNELPRKAYCTLIRKNAYSVYGTAYYKRFFRGHSVIYKVVKVPEVKKTVN
ncbi:MAG: hypothetical protein HOF76_17965 [Candidatus Scalindua sp.]|jgi:hypothetical protein|nr:hypothetical protein [Candidatus Scalindua sp.]